MLDISHKVVGLSRRTGLDRAGLLTVVVMYPLLVIAIKISYLLFISFFDFAWDEFPGILQKIFTHYSFFLWLFAIYLILMAAFFKAKRTGLAIALSFLLMGCVVWISDSSLVRQNAIMNSDPNFYIFRFIQVESLGVLATAPLYILFCWVLVFIYQKAFQYGGAWGLMLFSSIAGISVPVIGVIGILCTAPLVKMATQLQLIKGTP